MLSLDTLNREQARSVLEYVVGASEMPDSLYDVIYERTGGNALFTEEIGRALVESGALMVSAGQAIVTRPPDELQLPALLQSVIQARLDMLDATSLETLKIASVVGRVFDLDLLKSVCPSPHTVPAALADLLRRDLVHQMTSKPPIRYRFKHAVIQEATYGTLLHARRRDLHAAVAASLESLSADRIVDLYETLGFHYRKADIVDKAAQYLGYAAQRSSQLYQIPQAMEQYLSAIRIMDSVELTEGLKRMRIEFALALGRRPTRIHQAHAGGLRNSLDVLRHCAIAGRPAASCADRADTRQCVVAGKPLRGGARAPARRHANRRAEWLRDHCGRRTMQLRPHYVLQCRFADGDSSTGERYEDRRWRPKPHTHT